MGGEAPKVDQVFLADESDRKLRRALSFQDLFMISFGGVVGSGWLFAVSGAAALAGPASIVAWIICGIFMMAIGLCFAEVASSLHKTGQLVRGPLYSHGGFNGYVIAAAYILGSITVPAIEAEAVITYLASNPPNIIPNAVASNGLLTGQGVLIAAVLLVGFFFLNYVGVRFLGAFNTVVTWWKFIIPSLTIIFLFTVYHSSNLTAAGGFAPFGWPGIFTSIPTAGIGFAYLGFRGAAQFSGEAKNPQRDAPRAIVLSITAAVILYVLLQVVFIGAINWSAAGITPASWTGLTSGPLHTAPFYNVMKEAGPALLGGFAAFLLADAVISPAGTGWVFLGEATRAVYGVGADGFFPKPLLRIQHRTRIPWVALVVTTIVGGVFIAPFPSWYLFAGFVTDTFAVSLIMGPLTLLALRRHSPNMARPFTLPAAFWIGAIAFIGGSFVIYWTAFGGLFYVMSVIFLVLPLFFFFYVPRNMGVPLRTSVVLGAVQLVLTAVLTAIGYVSLYIGDVVSLSAKKPPASDGTLISIFAIYYVALLLIVVVPLIVLYRLSNPQGKKMINAGWWVIVLLLGMYVINFFTVYNSFPAVGGLLSTTTGYIPTPWDTPLFLVFAAAVYVWGIYSGYRTKDLEEVEELLARPDADRVIDVWPEGAGMPAPEPSP